MEEILGAHPINDDDLLGDTNPGDVSIDATISEEMMDEESVPPELLSKVPNVSQ